MPGKYCVVNGCKSWSVILKGKGVIRNVDPAWMPKKGARICSKHFRREDINGRKLKQERENSFISAKHFCKVDYEGRLFGVEIFKYLVIREFKFYFLY